MGHIYKITNKINGKVYVGQTIKSVEKRFSPSEQKSREIKFSKDGEEIIFKSSRDAAIWMMENNITKNKNYVSVRQEITARARKHKTFFGYTIEYIYKHGE